MNFERELDFEAALIQKLYTDGGWEPEVLRYQTEEDLIQNWANILFENNRDINRLNDAPLTRGEMQQILEEIALLRTPLKLNGFINGKSVMITRDNPDDKLNFGKPVSLKIYDRREIAAGSCRYQIAEQPVFTAKTSIHRDRRGDFMLLINGMPVIHVELKKSGVSVLKATEQIKLYAHEGVFSGLFSLIQIFVAMTPAETLYFANPGPDGVFNDDYFFQWADFNNEPYTKWEDIVKWLLTIPMAHMLIGFYTVADNTDGILKVMRSYLHIEYDPSKQLDLLIVVDQMLTGFDSKWINTLYLDKVLDHERLIQAFSRTNRLFNRYDKPFGIIRYYRYPHTMERNINEAFDEYSGERPLGLFVEKLEKNLAKLNEIFAELADLFLIAGIPDFSSLPEEKAEKGKFAKLFREFNAHLEAAIIQDFKWDKKEYTFEHEDGNKTKITVSFTGVQLESGLKYSSLSMGSGEQRVIKIISVLLAAEPFSLVLIDEIDLLLHVSALKRLIEIIHDIAVRKNIQVVFTTHSLEMIQLSRYVSIQYIHNLGEGKPSTVYKTITPDLIYSMTGQTHKTHRVYVEDNLAKYMVYQLVRKKQMSTYVDIIKYGAIENAFTIASGLVIQNEQTENILILLDGDRYRSTEEKKEQIKKKLSGTEDDAEEKRAKTLSMISEFSLPDDTSPEKFLHDIILRCFPDDNEIYDAANEIQAVGDSHEWVSGICDRLGVELSSLIQDVFTFASEDEEFIRYIHTIEDWMESHRPQ